MRKKIIVVLFLFLLIGDLIMFAKYLSIVKSTGKSTLQVKILSNYRNLKIQQSDNFINLLKQYPGFESHTLIDTNRKSVPVDSLEIVFDSLDTANKDGLIGIYLTDKGKKGVVYFTTQYSDKKYKVSVYIDKEYIQSQRSNPQELTKVLTICLLDVIYRISVERLSGIYGVKGVVGKYMPLATEINFSVTYD